LKIIEHHINAVIIAEVISEEEVITSAAEALDLLGNIYYQGYDKLIIYKKNITPDFFRLKNGMAGEILQKFSNYRVQLAIVGDFLNLESRSLRDFVFESNKGKQINFLSSKREALDFLSS
jgi:hypothetical protein